MKNAWEQLQDERDESGEFTNAAMAVHAIADNGCDCGDPWDPPCMACTCEAALKDLWEEREQLRRDVQWKKSIAEDKDKTLRMMRKLAEAHAAHDWQDAETSPSGKSGWRCSLCGKYSNAPVLACLDPCPERLRLWEEAQDKDCDLHPASQDDEPSPFDSDETPVGEQLDGGMDDEGTF